MNIESYIIGFVCHIAEYLCALLLYNVFLNTKSLNKRYHIVTGFLYASLAQSVNILQIPILNTISVYILIFCVALLFYCDNIITKLSFSAVYLCLAVFAEDAIGFIYCCYETIGAKEIPSNLFAFAIGAITSKIILYLSTLFIIRKFPDNYSSQNKKDIAILASFPVLGIITANMLLEFSGMMQLTAIQNLIIALFLTGLLAASIMVFFVYNRAMSKRELENQLAMNQKIHKMNEALFKEQQRSIEVSRRYIHDFKNHLQNIKALYESDNAQALDYEEKLISQLDKQVSYQLIDVNNYVISNIFERVRQQCEMNDIALTMEIRYNRLDFVDSLDASTLLDNIFDNALYACMGVEGERRISVKLNRVNDFVVLVVSNTKQSPVINENGHYLSTRRQYKERGFGIENIITTAEKYGGDAVMTYTDDEFTVTVRLKVD